MDWVNLQECSTLVGILNTHFLCFSVYLLRERSAFPSSYLLIVSQQPIFEAIFAL
jgi:hypothetical protein